MFCLFLLVGQSAESVKGCPSGLAAVLRDATQLWEWREQSLWVERGPRGNGFDSAPDAPHPPTRFEIAHLKSDG